MIKQILVKYFNSWWIPALVYLCVFAGFLTTAVFETRSLRIPIDVLLLGVGIAFLGLLVACIWNLAKKRWRVGIINLLFILGCLAVSFVGIGYVFVMSMFGPSEDGFADHLTIPEGIEIAEPEQDRTDPWQAELSEERDWFQVSIRNALAEKGDGDSKFVPAMPSLRKASTEDAKMFRAYVEASPDWHVFIEQGRHFAVRSWSYGGEPRNTLHGYISEFGGDSSFQTRCLLCLDRKQWSSYSVQHAQEGRRPVRPEMSVGNNMQESRVMIEAGGVWVEIFEQSNLAERRVTKATIANLEKEFAQFLKDPEAALSEAQARSRALAIGLAGDGKYPFRLLEGMQPGIYGIVYALNPGEPGEVYLKAFEVTQGTPLSVESLKASSKTRMAWSTDSSERFGAKSGFTIYEGDWGKPYAARFEVWFSPDSGKSDRKLAERIYKIEGWQR